MGPLRLWFLAGLVSLGFHAGLGLVLLFSVRPGPAPQQEPSGAEIEILSYPVERTQAPPAAPTTEPASEAQAAGAAAASAAVPASRADAAPLPQAPVAAAPPAAARLSASTATTERPASLTTAGPTLAAAPPSPDRPATTAPPPLTAAAPLATTGPALTAAAPDAQRPVTTTPSAAPVAAAAAPEQLAVAALADGAARLPAAGLMAARVDATQTAALSVAPPPLRVLTDASPPSVLATTPLRMASAQPAHQARPTPPPVETPPAAGPVGEHGPPRVPPTASLTPHSPAGLAAGISAVAPPASAVSAALAWSGDTETQVDPLSLAAIQSFMQPGDLDASAASAGTVRDAITGLLASVPCARLQTVFVPETGHLELRGHIPEEALRAPVTAALRGQVGGSIPLADNLLILPRPQCGVLAGIEALGLPQSSDQHLNPRVLGPDAHARVYRFTDGEQLVFELTGADYPAYVYVDYYDADGAVIHLQPNEIVPLRRVGVAEGVRIGAGGNTEAPALAMTVAPPFGQEIVVAFAASQPLYDGLRPLRELAGPYLDMLQAAIATARQRDANFKGEWVYFFVVTTAG